MNKVLDKLTQLTKTMKQYVEKVVLHLLLIVNTLGSINSDVATLNRTHNLKYF